MRQDITVQDDLHVLVRKTDRIFAGTEGHEDRIEPDEPDGHDYRGQDDIHHDHIPEHSVGFLIVFFTQIDRQ